VSWKVATLCAERRFGSPVRKQIIMYLADKASDDGSGIWCSKGTIARQTELGETTVKRAISEFVSEGILIETGRRHCVNGYTTVYSINLGQIGLLGPIHDPDTGTGFRADGVQSGPGTGTTEAGVPGPQRTPNNPKTSHKPPTRKSAAEVGDQGFEAIWAAFPSDRRRGRPACLAMYRAAIGEGHSHSELLQAVQGYAQESEGFTRSKVSFSDNWFRQGRWRERVEALREEQAEAVTALNDQLSRLAVWVREGSTLCRHITPKQARGLLTRGMVQNADLLRVGVAS
jgi:hypothetical protein